MKKCIVSLLSVMMVIWMIFPFGAFADTLNKITIRFYADGTPVYGATFKIYHALDRNAQLTGEFSDYPIEIGDLHDSEAMSILSDTLSAYASRDKLTPIGEGVTDADGYLTFEGLERGVYLIVGKATKVGDAIYNCKPCIISVPFVNDDETEESHVVLHAKYAVLSAGDIRQYTVRKVWNDIFPDDMHKGVTVQLLRDGDIVNEVTLDASNGWEHTWKNLAPEFNWQVTESNIPESYTVSILLDETEYIIKNKFNGDDSGISETRTTAPSEGAYETKTTTTTATAIGGIESATTVSAGGTTATSSADETTPTASQSSALQTNTAHSVSTTRKTITTAVKVTTVTQENPPKLPQTGQLWWPVPIMLIAGALMFVGGIIDFNEDYDEKT